MLEGEVEIGVSEGERERLERDGGFGAVEKKAVDRQVLVGQGRRLEDLERRSRRDWEDPYEKSRALRREFRVGRKVRKEGEETGERLKEKFSLGVEMVEETGEDAVRAGLVEFAKTEDRRRKDRGLFEQEATNGKFRLTDTEAKRRKKFNTADMMAKKSASLADELRGNTRAVLDPFSASQNKSSWQPVLKRRRPDDQHSDHGPTPNKLVEYDSDSLYHSIVFPQNSSAVN